MLASLSRHLTTIVLILAGIALCLPCQTIFAADSRLPLVVIGTAKTASILQQVPLTGTVTSPKTAHLSAQVSGQVKRLAVDEGDRVNTGDVLLELDNELESLTLEAARAATRQAQAELDDAHRRHKDAKVLSLQKSIPANELDLLQAEVRIKQAALAKQQAEEQRQQAQLARYTVTAPFAGVVSEKHAEVGEWINPGIPILTLVATDKLRVDFRVPQEFYPRINAQSRIVASFDAMPGQHFDARMTTLVPISDPNARTFLLRTALNDQALHITPGMSVHGNLQLDTGQQGVVVSRDALLRYPDGRVTVWVVKSEGEQNTVSERLVQIGHSFDAQVSIPEGLQADETIVLEGNEALKEGQAVRIYHPE